MSAICAWVLVTFIGAKLFSGEMSYGVGLMFGPLGALIVGGAVFIVLFRKIRSI